jgi:hypothetical protein
MAGIKGKSGPPGNQNAFRHGLAAVQQRRANGSLTQDEHDIRTEVLTGLLADKGGEAQISTAMRVLSGTFTKTIGIVLVACLAALAAGGSLCQDDVDLEPNQFGRKIGEACILSLRFSILNLKVLSLNVAEIPKPLAKRPDAGSRNGTTR